ncbi:Aspartic proteinase nepenthesin-1 [Acorus calamus]|uniref:Aspartic proteinase nepenthesin-1 n=1 Tax=Acorus calamus TaxID=4465 RepID=A0AAV9C1U1_ACOCL|nr:Aspartic proteinase nepenthesin-1 [Acorus calamus]
MAATLVLAHSVAAAALITQAIEVSLTHVDSDLNLTQTELVSRAAARGSVRLSSLHSKSATDLRRSLSLSSDGNEYYMNISVGTPPVTIRVFLDTGSDVFWISCFNRSTNGASTSAVSFDPHRSSTYRVIPCKSPRCVQSPIPFMPRCDPSKNCTYELVYADGSATNGTMALETITLGGCNPVSVPDVAFGCSVSSSGNALNTDGILGFGRGEQSIVSQLGIGRFSYCLTPFGSSRLVLGPREADKDDGVTVTVPLLPTDWATWYNIDLVGISVGGTALAIPKDTFKTNGFIKPGVVLDNGSTLTYLDAGAYDPLKNAILAKAGFSVVDGTPYELDVCFNTSGVAAEKLRFPELVFHFRGGVDFKVPQENYMMGFAKDGVHCLAILSEDGISILGSYLQQNFWVGYDLKNNLVSFTPSKCARE